MLLQVGGAIPRSSLELLKMSSGETQVVLAITASSIRRIRVPASLAAQAPEA